MCVGVKYLAFNVLSYTKSLKPGFSMRNILLQIIICVGCVWIVIGYFLFEKEAFHGLLKVIGIQNPLKNMLRLIEK